MHILLNSLYVCKVYLVKIHPFFFYQQTALTDHSHNEFIWRRLKIYLPFFFYLQLQIKIHLHLKTRPCLITSYYDADNLVMPDDARSSLWHGNAIRHQKSWSIQVQVMASYLMAPSHYLVQCWLTISEVFQHYSQGNVIWMMTISIPWCCLKFT